ncbi:MULTISPECIES: phosphatidylserine/phosphatidylglycerophosphate/cardiolipin synthase family protein [Pseudomonas]|uniref:Phosphatidylserine/phosphatidylglycerophosphate/ cardiolipin synthase family protein n=1 Tax=Pseudomonas sessilinigenes TaxID=658629 RepID=A0ABX8MTU5_9PSED|nr:MULTISPECIES: phosphatidylserine/phosphatidylglycerophosphate/cardiolipin synthase family protein [Pseudomonas]AZC23097.1 Cardiolipin synthetase [Pseudomonas sessilinigenes]QIH06701.1 phosphatidylserine/phosphatidylglycerophosphate/cardiolipin synthase family protein [Pseudomonas sp. BIOMIG1BAC]QXH42117.1 phosphatidylserine/phosphatidylglycerophosphate/cardiolipin synthase family protein [Pseudomonas sessilinigenes]UMZ13450.1 phosphatidylserine/phosphatidylglycerophosphate/cardiolipin syntha
MRAAVFPWREGNRFELLVDGPEFFPRMLVAIARAQQQVELELYLVEAGSCAQAMVEAMVLAAERGVRVRCLFDDYGSLAFPQALRRTLTEAGVELRFYNRLRWRQGLLNLYRDHRKLLLVDQSLAVVGGTGVTDEFWLPESNSCEWHEVMVQVSGPIVRDWQLLFDRQWDANLHRGAWKPHADFGLQRLPRLPDTGEGLGRLAYADARQHRDILHSLIRALHSGQRRIWLATPYFLPTWSVRRSLRKAAARGLDVRLLLTGPRTDHPAVRYAGHRYYPRLLKAGVRIFEYQPQFLHLKMVLVDNWVSVGSCNFDHWNLRFNLEANLEAVDPVLTAAVVASFEKDFVQSEEVSLAVWRNRPLWRRIKQRIWGWVDRLVVNLLDRRG